MKKNILFILCFIAVQINLLQAQSFSIPYTQYVNWSDGTVNLLSRHIPITNTSSQNIDVIVEKIVNNLAPHHSSLFCFGISCYDTTYNSSGVITFAGGSQELLIADLNTNFAIGQSCVTYRIKDVNNNSDYADVEVCYNVTATGVNTFNSTPTISLPKPNPADKFTALTYDLKGNVKDYNITIFNMIGKKVQVNKLSNKNGVLLLPTSELPSGVYFYSLTEGDKVISTNKLIVAHKN